MQRWSHCIDRFPCIEDQGPSIDPILGISIGDISVFSSEIKVENRTGADDNENQEMERGLITIEAWPLSSGFFSYVILIFATEDQMMFYLFCPIMGSSACLQKSEIPALRLWASGSGL